MPQSADEEQGSDREMLADALQKARKLVAELQRQGAQIEASPPQLPPDKLAAGKQAFENALASAQRMLNALEDAARLDAAGENAPRQADESL